MEKTSEGRQISDSQIGLTKMTIDLWLVGEKRVEFCVWCVDFEEMEIYEVAFTGVVSR